VDPALRNEHLIFRHVGGQIQRGLQASLKAVQVSIVNAYQVGAQLQSLIQFRPIVHLDQYIDAYLVCISCQLDQLRRL